MRRRIICAQFRFPFRLHRSAFIACFLAFLFSLSMCVAFGNAQEEPKQKIKEWQIDGILAALDDGYSGVKAAAFRKLSEFDAEDLKAFSKQAEEIGKRAIDILKNSKEDSSLRSRAASALGNAGRNNVTAMQLLIDVLKNSKEDSSVRNSAGSALRNADRINDTAVQDLTKILNNNQEDSYLRTEAATVLGNAGKTNNTAVQVLAEFIKNKRNKEIFYLRTEAAQALGDAAKANDAAVQTLTEFIKKNDEDSRIRIIAASALGDLGRANDINVPVLIGFLKGNSKEEEPYFRFRLASSLGNTGKADDIAVQVLTEILKTEPRDPNADFRGWAASALGNLGKTNDAAVQALIDFLKDNKEYPWIRIGNKNRLMAAKALGNTGKAHDIAVQTLIEFLKNSDRPELRTDAAQALGNLGKTNDAAVQALIDFLKDNKEYPWIRIVAAKALRNTGKAHDIAVQTLIKFLKNNDSPDAARALSDFRPLALSEVFIFIEHTHNLGSHDFVDNRLASYFYGGGTSEIKTLLKWIGRPQRASISIQLSHDEAKKNLEVFANAWEASREFPESRAELAGAIAEVAKMVKWQTGDISLLEKHYKNLSNAKSNNADSVKAAIDSLTVWKYFNQLRNIAAAHLTFWAALIFAYPKSPQVQAIFFWNPWVRKIGGAGYVGFLLAWVPFLRRKLFEPFRDSLLADAKLHSFKPHAYFPDSEVTLKGTDQFQPLQTVFPEIKGQSILEGDSGLGKTLFLRHLVKASQRIVVYLPAEKCEKGVIEAIQAKLHGQAQDADFLRNLIYSGAIDICIDGLNEVSADTRATISDFVERYFKGNILMTTQPIEWSPPSTAKTYVLQPLRPDQIQTFLISRQTVMPVVATYATDCDRYLQSALSPNQSPEERTAAQRILSNPMDLSIVAQMLAQGRTPDLFRLQEQQYTLMAKEYHQIYSSEFPLKPFSEAVYQRRLNDEPALPADEFYNELICMEDDKHKMVISRQWKDTKGEIQKEWYFRHDKIAEFFIVQTFLGDSETAQTRMYEHLGDPRFRGVYFLLATFLSIDAAQDLRETLIQYAADTKDHTVSDTFVQLLRTRKA